jgi:hypothetical protein
MRDMQHDRGIKRFIPRARNRAGQAESVYVVCVAGFDAGGLSAQVAQIIEP